MSDMKCPFCGEKLQQTYSFNPKQFWCSNYYDHKHPINMQGTKELWQELIRTRKALNKAKWWLNEIVENHRYTPISTAEIALKEITALEQKDVK
ncbi:MAG: hypothetical protein J6S67_23280 [Methanobrevibacter sp.]|nr:hypothetical protein [Methanobrevibacter sp.]